MTGVALLTQAVTTPEPAFYETFFATVAVLIPVFFLAVAVQGNLYQDLLKGSGDVADRLYPVMIAQVILIAGTAGEICAILALYSRRIGDDTAPYVLAATIILVIAAGWGPAVAYAKALGSGHAGATPPARDDQPAAVPPAQPSAQSAFTEDISGNGRPGGIGRTDDGVGQKTSGKCEGS